MTDKRAILGNMGERLVADLLNLKLSDDAYDSRKDATDVYGKTYEVKTQDRHPTKPLLTISAPDGDGKHLVNLLKCLTVDFLIFVEFDSSDIIKVWHCKDRSTYEIYTTRNGKRMIGFPVDNMKQIFKVQDAELAASMRSHSSSFKYN